MPTQMETINFIEELKSGRCISSSPFEMPLTILIQTYNDTSTLTVCLKQLKKQNIICDVIVYDTGSNDGTPEMIQKQIEKEKYYPIRLKLIHKPEMFTICKNEKKIIVRKEIANEVTTDFIMFLTATIMLPPFAIRKMFEEFDDNTGMVGLRYDPQAFHVQMGAAILRTKLAKEIEWDKYLQCNCRNARDQLLSKGYLVKQHPTLLAYHLTGIL